MNGQYRIAVFNEGSKYDLMVSRKITIINGDSATGKTVLVETIKDYYEFGENSGVTLKCQKPFRALFGKDWNTILLFTKENIVFIDEESFFLSTIEFAELLKFTNNYYVIITREQLKLIV